MPAIRLTCALCVFVTVLWAACACTDNGGDSPDGDILPDGDRDGELDADLDNTTPDGDIVDGDPDAEPEPDADRIDTASDYRRDVLAPEAIADAPYNQQRVKRFVMGAGGCSERVMAIVSASSGGDRRFLVTDSGICELQVSGSDGLPSGALNPTPVYTGYGEERTFVDAVWTGKRVIAATRGALHLYDPLTDSWTHRENYGGRVIQALHHSAIGGQGTLYVGTEHGVQVFYTDYDDWGAMLLYPDQSIQCFASDQTGIYIGSSTALNGYHPSLPGRIWTSLEGLPSDNVTALLATGGDSPAIVVGTDAGLAVLRQDLISPLDDAMLPLPYLGIHALAAEPDGALWAGADGGALRFDGERWQVFAAQSWLPGPHVRALFSDAQGMWVGTLAGLARIWISEMTLFDKQAVFAQRLAGRHLFSGQVMDLDLLLPADMNTASPDIDSPSLIWTAFYSAAMCARFSLEMQPEPIEAARESLDSLLALHTVTAISGYPASQRISTDMLPQQPSDAQGHDWHKSADGNWWWQDGFDLPQLAALLFGITFYQQHCANEIDDPKLKALAAALGQHLLDHDFAFTGENAARADALVLTPEKLGEAPLADLRGLRALALVASLSVIYELTDDARFDDARRELIADGSLLLWIKHERDDSLMRLADPALDMTALLFMHAWATIERDAFFMEQVDDALADHWEARRREQMPLVNILYGSVLGEPLDLAPSVEQLQRWPLDGIDWTQSAGNRSDLQAIAPDAYPDSALGWMVDGSGLAVPLDERPLPDGLGRGFILDGGSEGLRAENGAAMILAYWLAKVYGMIDDDVAVGDNP